MGELPKLLALIAATALLLTGAAACGDGGDSDPAPSQSPGSAEGPSSSGGDETGPAGSDDDGAGEQSAGGRTGEDGGREFEPQAHDDSGGGASQFRVKGGDNSVQEFGEEAEGAEFESAATVVHEFLDARAQGAWAAACERLSSAVVESFRQLADRAEGGEAPDCAEILEKLTNPAAKQAMVEEARRADVGSLRVEGDRAFVIYRGPGDAVMAMPMAKEDGDWKVASLAGTPLN